MDDLVLVGDDHRRRREALDQLQVQLAPRADAGAGRRALQLRRQQEPVRQRHAARIAVAVALLQIERARERALLARRRQTLAPDPPRLVDPVLLVDRLEQMFAAVDGLGGAEEEPPARAQREVGDLDGALLGIAVEIDEQVAAAEQIDARKGRVLQQVVHREQHRLAQVAAHPVAAPLLGEEAAQPFLGDVGRERQRIEALACRADRAFVEIGREHLQRRRRIERSRVLRQQHRDRVRLFAGRARRHPDPHLVVRRLAGEQHRHLRLERVERFAIAEEVGDADEQVLQQRAGLAGMGAHERQVIGQGLDAADAHAPGDPAQDRRPLVVAEVAPGLRPQIGEHVAQRGFALIGRDLGRLCRLRPGLGRQLEPAEQLVIAADPGRHLGDAQHPVDHSGGDCRARHPGVLGLVGVLGNRQAAALLDALDADRAVAIGAREDDRCRARPVGIGQGAKEHVDGDAPAAVGRDVGAVQIAVRRGDRLAGRDDVDVVGLDPRRVAHLVHRHGRRALQDRRQQALVVDREVHDDDEGEAGLGRRRFEESLQGGDSARRSAEADHRQHRVGAGRHGVVEDSRQAPPRHGRVRARCAPRRRRRHRWRPARHRGGVLRWSPWSADRRGAAMPSRRAKHRFCAPTATTL